MSTKSIPTVVFVAPLDTLQTRLRAAVDALETSSFVLTGQQVVKAVDSQGIERDAILLTAVHQDYMPQGSLTADAAGRLRMADGYVTTPKLAAGVVSADAAGRALLAAGLFDEATVDAAFAAGAIDGSDRLKAASVGTDRLAFEPLLDGGRLAVGYVMFLAGVNIVAGATVTIGAGEVWTAVAGAPAAREFQLGAGSTASAANLKNQINADATSQVWAFTSGQVLILVARTTGAGNLALAVDVNVGGGGVAGDMVPSAATMTGSRAAADRRGCGEQYVVTANDLTAMDPMGISRSFAIAAFAATSLTLGGFVWRDSGDTLKAAGAVAKPQLYVNQIAGQDVWMVLVAESGAAASLAAGDKLGLTVAW